MPIYGALSGNYKKLIKTPHIDPMSNKLNVAVTQISRLYYPLSRNNAIALW